MSEPTKKDPHAVALGRRGGMAVTPAKRAASAANIAVAREAKYAKQRAARARARAEQGTP